MQEQNDNKKDKKDENINDSRPETKHLLLTHSATPISFVWALD